MQTKTVFSHSFQYKPTVLFYLLLGVLAFAPSAIASLIETKNDKHEIVVSNLKELNSAISSAAPGDAIIMKDGIWHNAVIDFNASANSSAPITLRAQTPGNVILNGNSKLTFTKPYLIVDGLFFKDGAIKKGSVITFNSDHCRLTNSAILDYNPAQFETNYYWVFFRGNYNRMDHCLLKGKSNLNPVIQNDEENSRHNTVAYCHIKDIPYANHNGREIMRIFGYGHADQMGDDGAYFTIEYNLFERAHGEGVEIVSLKSNYNIVRYNTVRATRGGLVGRRGKNNTFEGNFIFGENQEGSEGIRVAGQNHRVINNYICDVAEDGLRLIAGEYYKKSLTNSFKSKKKDLPMYLEVQDGYFAQNTIINAGGNGIDIGYHYKDRWPDLQLVLLPENNLLINNLVYNCKQNTMTMAVQDNNPPLDFLTFKPNRFEGNIVFGGNIDIIPLPSGIKSIDPKLIVGEDGLFRPIKGSPVIHSGASSDVKDDMDGQVRDKKKDVGADELSGAKPKRHPLTANDVGPEWVIQKRNAGEKF